MVTSTSGEILTSSDGTTWTLRTSGITRTLNDITYGNSIFVAVGGEGKIITSSDGSSWTVRTSGSSSTLGSVTYGDGKFIVTKGCFLASLKRFSELVNLRVERLHRTSFPLTFVTIFSLNLLDLRLIISKIYGG